MFYEEDSFFIEVCRIRIMFSIAFVGADGAGKTTVTRRLEKVCPQLPIKYLYMGLSTLKSEPALPTTRLLRYLKLRSYRKKVDNSKRSTDNSISLYDHYYKDQTKRGKLWLTARNINTLADISYRQTIAFFYKLRGFVVVFDRHFLFMLEPNIGRNQKRKKSFGDRLLYWIYDTIYPKPDVVFFLDAPPEVLYERKKEVSIDNLIWQRQIILKQCEKIHHFIWLDATQPLDKILEEVSQRILEFYNSKLHKQAQKVEEER
jgi:thymidylate kinase